MKLSVMMITYNHERFITQALAGILAQRVNFDFEIVVGEDCSTDSTRDILMDFHRRYPSRIVPLVRDHNLGVVRNLQQTLTACRGEYLALIEGDDYWTSEDKLQRQVDFLDSHPDYAICCHRVKILDETGLGSHGLDSTQTGLFPSNAAGPYTIEDLLRKNFIMTCTVVCRRGSVSLLPSWLLDMKLADLPMFALLARHGKIELMDDVMAVYRVHSGNIWSSRPYIYRLREGIRMLTALDEHLGFEYTNTIRQTLARSYLELARSHLEMATISRRDRNRTETGKHVLGCLRNGGWWLLRDSRRSLAALSAYALFGSWYEALMRAKRANRH